MPRRVNFAGGMRGFLALLLLSSALPALGDGAVSSCTEASLRAALLGGGVVSFSNDCTITLSQQIVINQADTTLEANGHNVVLSGSNAVPLLRVTTNLTIHGVSFLNGSSPASGGALYIQPGVVVVAKECIFAGNSALGTNGFAGGNGTTNSTGTGGNGSSATSGNSAWGGAVYNLGNLALVNCTLTNNTATGGAGGDGGGGGPGGGSFALGGNGGDGGNGGVGSGGAVYNLGNLTIINSSFSANTALGGKGGQGGTAGSGTIPGIPGNGGTGGSGSGGGVFNARNLTIIASTFATNSTRGGASAAAGMHGNGRGLTGLKGGLASGGAIHNDWWATVTNCTFYSNTVTGGAGGNGGNGGGTFGVPGDGGDGGDGIGGALDNANTITVVSCTFSSGATFGGTNGLAGSGKLTGAAGNFGGALGANIANTGPIMLLMDSIVAAGASGANIFGSFTDGGYNLSSDSVASLGGLSLQNVDPKLGTLAARGGPTLTMALLTGSPAIDRIGPDASPTTDQRGLPRPINGLSDIGAFEFGAAVTVTNFMLSIGRTANGQIQLNGAGTAGLNYVVQASTNLLTWQAVSTNTSPVLFKDPVTNLPARFYRITR